MSIFSKFQKHVLHKRQPPQQTVLENIWLQEWNRKESQEMVNETERDNCA